MFSEGIETNQWFNMNYGKTSFSMQPKFPDARHLTLGVRFHIISESVLSKCST